jgi:hypothetical protein
MQAEERKSKGTHSAWYMARAKWTRGKVQKAPI